MKVQLESTTKIVTLIIGGCSVPARVWEGVTDSGIPVHAFITRVAAPDSQGWDLTQFEVELNEQRKPSPEVAEIPLRLIL